MSGSNVEHAFTTTPGERLLLSGLRAMRFCFKGREPRALEDVWSGWDMMLGADSADLLIGHVGGLVRRLDAAALRPVVALPIGCHRMSGSEALVLQLVGAQQHRQSDLASLATARLVTANAIAHVLEPGRKIGALLLAHEHALPVPTLETIDEAARHIDRPCPCQLRPRG